MTDFKSLGLCDHLLSAIEANGYDTPTPIQKDAIPYILDGNDLVGLAQTGTGKTAAFGLPLVQQLLANDSPRTAKSSKALILAPTRELVNQIAKNLIGFVRGTKLRVQSVVGGVAIGPQIKRLTHGTDILVATPGRLLDLIDRDALTLNGVSFLVLDEADQMLDLGFIHALKRISSLIPKSRQTLLFSATMPKQINDLARSYLTDPVQVEVAPAGKTADKIVQGVHFLEKAAKTDFLVSLLKERPDDLSLVFCRTKHGAERLMRKLVAAKLSAGSIHGNKSQSQRDKAIKALRQGTLKILVATDVAARGIDIPGVRNVYNFDLPEVPEAYVHRIGRTARAGADGEAFALCCPEEIDLLRRIEKLIGISIAVASGEVPPASAAAPSGKKRRGRSGNRRSNAEGKAGNKRFEAKKGSANDNAPKQRKRRPQRASRRPTQAA